MENALDLLKATLDLWAEPPEELKELISKATTSWFRPMSYQKTAYPKRQTQKGFQRSFNSIRNGIGKRTNVYLFPLQKRGGMGVKASNVTVKTGKIADAKIVDRKIKQVIITTKQAQVIKLPLRNIPRLGRWPLRE